MSLRLKMVVGIGAILLGVILVYTVVASRTQARHLMEMSRHEAELIAAVADRALAKAMEEGEREVVRAILGRIGEHAAVAGIRIVDAAGAIHQPNRPEEVGRILAARERPPAGGAATPLGDLRERTVGVFRPIANGPACYGCHPSHRTLLGYLNVRVFIPALDSPDTRHWTVVMVAAIGSLIAAGGLIGVLFTFVVGRRIDALAHAMGRVEAGDLAARAPDGTRDELGRLGRSFNAMVARLADARRRLEDRHAEAIRRAEHLASLGKLAAGVAHEINNPSRACRTASAPS